MSAPCDEISDWYEDEFLSDRSDDGLRIRDPIGVDGALCEMLGQGASYGSQPNDPTNGRTDHPVAEGGVYFRTPDGHLFEVMSSAVRAR